MELSLTLNLGFPTDDQHANAILEILQGLISAKHSPKAAAEAIDKAIVDECNAACEAYNSSAGSKREGDDAELDGPDPVGWQRFLWYHLSKVATIVPADYPGPQQIVDLLLELQRLPRHKVPYVMRTPGYLAAPEIGTQSDSADSIEKCVPEKIELTSKELWSLTPENQYEGLIADLEFLERGEGLEPSAR